MVFFLYFSTFCAIDRLRKGAHCSFRWSTMAKVVSAQCYAGFSAL